MHIQDFQRALGILGLVFLSPVALLAASSPIPVVCGAQAISEIKSKSQDRVLFEVKRQTKIKVFQDFGGGRIQFGNMTQIQAEDSDGDLRVGWMLTAEIKNKEDCKEIVSKAVGDKTPETRAEKIPPPQRDQTAEKHSGCCLFPIASTPNEDFTSGMRRFGASRNGGDRIHAGADIYKNVKTPIRAVAGGSIINGIYKFYQGTYALEVKHTGGFVVRYGEILGRTVRDLDEGDRVSAGQDIAYMGRVNSGCCEPMLHFEMYSGRASGSLTSGGRYQRRSDLINPTNQLLQWEKNL